MRTRTAIEAQMKRLVVSSEDLWAPIMLELLMDIRALLSGSEIRGRMDIALGEKYRMKGEPEDGKK